MIIHEIRLTKDSVMFRIVKIYDQFSTFGQSMLNIFVNSFWWFRQR